MQFLEHLEENSILIIPNNLKSKVLDYLNDNSVLKSIKLMTFNDLKKGLMFDYDTRTIKAVMDYLNVSYGIAKSYISSLYYINEENYANDKLNTLFKLKKYLEENNLLIKDTLFKNLISSKLKVYVYGFDYIKLFDKYLLDQVKDLTTVQIIEKEENNYAHTIYEFKSIYEEVSFVFESILSLIDKGVSLDKIYIANYSDEYYFVFKTLMNAYKLPIYLRSNSTLYSTAIGNYFLNNLDNNIDSLIYKIKKKFKYEENAENANIINSISNMMNNYYWSNGDYVSLSELIENDMKNRIVKSPHFKEEIITTNIIDNIFSDDEYVFLIGFNLGSIPKLKRDEDFINDTIKPEYLETTDVYNKMIKETYLKAIKNIKNLVITYKLGTHFSTCEKSFLANNEIFTIEKVKQNVSSYSDDINKLNLSRAIDELIKFNEESENINLLFSNYETLYKSYDNKFTGIDVKTLRNAIDDNIVFSYSNISDYYKCPFMFYNNHILKLKSYKSELPQFIGNVFHYVLEKCLDSEIPVQIAYQEYIDMHSTDLEFTNKENFFIDTLKDELEFVVETIKEQQMHSKHTMVLHEHEIVVDIKRKINTKIKGFVDKILVLNNSMLVVDYKTTNAQAIDSDVFEFGLSIQLPIYLYLLKCLDNNTEVAGIYIQHILDLDNVYSPTKDPILEKKNNLKLEGITFDSIDLISKFDDTYEKSNIIRSLFVKDGEIKKTKNILSLEERDALCELMEELIMNCIDDVSDAKFDIKPIKIDKHADGCQYCDFKDVCFRKFKDFNKQAIQKKGSDDGE